MLGVPSPEPPTPYPSSADVSEDDCVPDPEETERSGDSSTDADERKGKKEETTFSAKNVQCHSTDVMAVLF